MCFWRFRKIKENKMKTINYWLLALAFVFASCNTGASSDKNDEKTSANREGKSTVKSAQKSGNKKMNDCFKAYKDNIQPLLTKADVLQHIDIDNPALLEEKYSDFSSQQELVFTYESDRTVRIEVPNLVSVEKPEDNRIALNKFEVSDDSEKDVLMIFDRTYKGLTEKEYEAAIANLEKSYADKPKEVLEQAKKFVAARKNMKYQAVDNLGTAAYWMEVQVQGINYGVELVVLAGVTQFTLDVKVTEDNQENLKTAVAIAKEILKKCA